MRTTSRQRGIAKVLADVELFKALAEPSRARLLERVLTGGGRCSVSEAATCCDLDLSVVSRHLQILARAGWLTAEKDGRQTIYTVTCAHLAKKLRALADALEAYCPNPKP